MRNVKLSITSIFCIFLFFSSCSSKRDIVYLQDINKDRKFELKNSQFFDYKINYGDILKISVASANPENTISLNQRTSNTSFNQNRESLIFEGYIVDKQGNIDFPQLGSILVFSLSIKELKELIKTKLSENQILINPVIDVKILNWSYTILGEVNNPGRFYFDEPDFNILQAIGVAGDLTINGKRDNIKIIRDNDKGELSVETIDMTKSDFLATDFFQINSGDVIIVEPNTNRVKNAGIIGNSGTLLSLLSFILSSIIVINN